MLGFLNINKPPHITSFDVIHKLRKILQIKKIGHAGTLDPLATGVLVAAVGKSTRLLEYLVGLDKTYQTELILGKISDSYDADGIIKDYNLKKIPTKNEIQVVIKKYQGTIDQIPPRFSAIKINGQKAYDLARKGIKLELKSRKITVHAIEILAYNYPKLALKIKCGSGTYIRSLGHDIGQDLKTGAYINKLIRRQVGQFSLKNSVDLNSITGDNVHKIIISSKQALSFLPQIELNQQQLTEIKMGRTIISEQEYQPDEIIFGYLGEDFQAILTYDETKEVLRPRKVIY